MLSQLENIDSANWEMIFGDERKQFSNHRISRIGTALAALLFGFFSGLGGNTIFNQPLPEVEVSEDIPLPTYPKRLKLKCFDDSPLMLKSFNKLTLEQRIRMLKLLKKISQKQRVTGKQKFY